MPANVVKSERDEKLWNKAKKKAKEQGKGEDYAYIMGIYKKMKGDNSDNGDSEKEAAFRRGYYRALRAAGLT